MSTTTFEHWKIDNLKNHHLNAEVFGQLSVDADCGEFAESVKRDGILQPLVVVPDGPKVQAGTIISGHRRLQAAAKAGLKEVPVIVRRDLKTQLDIDRVWFDTNRNREMTTEQKARWFKKREAIEAAAAKSRQSAAGGKSPGSAQGNIPLSAGKAADIAAADVGMSGKTAKAAAAVVEVIDESEASGDKETAAKLRETLNGKSVSAAKREADKVKPPGKPKLERKKKAGDGKSPAKLVDDLSKKHVGPLVRGIDAVAEINGGKGLAHVCANDALNDLIAALKRMRGGEK